MKESLIEICGKRLISVSNRIIRSTVFLLRKKLDVVYQLDFRQSEPARVASPGEGVIHSIISNQEKGLEEFHTPAQRCRLASLLSYQK
jgi:hypothetical protein